MIFYLKKVNAVFFAVQNYAKPVFFAPKKRLKC